MIADSQGGAGCGSFSLQRERTAVVVVDVQNDYYSLDGALAPSQDFSVMGASVQPQIDLLSAATDTGVLVVFVRAVGSMGHPTTSATKILERVRSNQSYAFDTPEWVVEGTWGSEVLAEVRAAAPQGVEVVKNRTSGFLNTNLDLVLGAHSISTVVVTGMATDGCVAATVRDAADHGYRVVVVRDAVGSYRPDLHAAALEIFADRYDVRSSAEVIAQLTTHDAPVPQEA